MKTILAVSPNPCIDRTEVLAHFELGKIHRPLEVLSLPGGKGLNAARAIRRLGGDVLVCTLLAGFNGAWVTAGLQREGIRANITWIEEGETRYAICVLDESNRVLTETYENGIPVTPVEWQRFEELVACSLVGVDLAVFCGSLPPGAPLDGYGRLINLVQTQAIPVILDARGDYLHHALLAKPHIVKVNAEEAGEVTGITIESPEEAVKAAQKIHNLGIAQVIITLGKKGAVAVGEGISNSKGTVFAPAPQLESICAVGSGDAFLGGLAYALQRGESFEAALKLGVACGSANTLCIGQGIFEISLAKELAGQIQLI